MRVKYNEKKKHAALAAIGSRTDEVIKRAQAARQMDNRL